MSSTQNSNDGKCHSRACTIWFPIYDPRIRCLPHPYTTSGITSHTEMLVPHFTKRGQTIRTSLHPSCCGHTWKTSYVAMVKLLMAYLIYQDILHIDLPPAEKKISKKNNYIRNSFFLPFRWVRCWKQRVNASIYIILKLYKLYNLLLINI